MAHAIGIDPFYPPGVGPTPDPILSSVGGVVDGESVLDFINDFKDLIPVRPNSIGFNVASGVTSAIPNWNNINAILTGGYQQGSNVQNPLSIPNQCVVYGSDHWTVVSG
jgi:hypothetical protein